MKVGETSEHSVEAEPSETEPFHKEMNASCGFLGNATQRDYGSEYSSDFQKKIEEHNDWVGDYVTESFNLVLADPPYDPLSKLSRRKSSSDSLTDK